MIFVTIILKLTKTCGKFLWALKLLLQINSVLRHQPNIRCFHNFFRFSFSLCKHVIFVTRCILTRGIGGKVWIMGLAGAGSQVPNFNYNQG